MLLLLLSCAPAPLPSHEEAQVEADFDAPHAGPTSAWTKRVPVVLQQPATTVLPDPNDAISRGFGPFAGGDFNGDGYADLAIGAVNNVLGGSGEVWIHSGSSGGVSSSATQTLSSAGAASFGYSLLAADFDGDGIDDLAVGGPNESGDTGAVWVYLGGSSGLHSAGSIAGTPSGNAAVGSLFGIVLAAGDVDGDGDDELFVSATGIYNWGGEITVFDGGSGGPFTPLYSLPQSTGTYQGWALAVGDLTGDGLADLAVGSAVEEVNVFAAGSGLPSNYVDWTLYGPSGANNFGEALAYVEDSDGDGQGELAVGADAANYGAGEIQLYGGGTTLITTLAGSTANLGLGCSLSTLDSNGDGLSDLLAGACATSSLTPYQVQLFEGSSSSLVASTSLVPPNSNSGYRYPAGLGDVNGDGYDDAALLSYSPREAWVLLGDADSDGDGSGDREDCAPTDAAIHPGAPELCDGLDNNCDGNVDEGIQTSTWYLDADNDGYGDPTQSQSDCAQPAGTVSNSDDCDDTNVAVNLWATELCDGLDNNCNGATDEGLSTPWYADADNDGYGDPSQSQTACSQPTGTVANTDDCDDTNSTINLWAPESCDGLDNNCNGSIDEGLPSVSWYTDSDGDGDGDPASLQSGCAAPTGSVSNATDCDDNNLAIYGGATELCDNIDNNCDSNIDEGLLSTWYPDGDGDSFGTATGATQACSAPTGSVGNADDCYDSDATSYPGATELCDGLDNDCNGTTDDGAGSTWYEDLDGDGFGSSTIAGSGCTQPSGSSATGDDCNDSDDSIFPGATEVSGDGIDQDCNGTDDSADSDGDGTADPLDCQPLDNQSYPGATEVCDGRDNNCDGVVDEGQPLYTWHFDGDGDGYGDPDTTQDACLAPPTYIVDESDCDDSNPQINPGATEIAGDGIDQNCDKQDDPATCGCNAQEGSASSALVGLLGFLFLRRRRP